MNLLKERGIKKGDFANNIGIKTNTLNALSKNRNVNISTIDKICEYLCCQPYDIMEFIPNNKDKQKEELRRQIKELQEQLEQLNN